MIHHRQHQLNIRHSRPRPHYLKIHQRRVILKKPRISTTTSILSEYFGHRRTSSFRGPFPKDILYRDIL